MKCVCSRKNQEFAKTNNEILKNMKQSLGKGIDAHDKDVIEKLIHDTMRDKSLYTGIRADLEEYK